MENEAEIPTSQNSTSNITLSITFSGPLLFVFPPPHRNDSVYIFAPYCPYHQAGIFYSNGSQSEIDLWKKALSCDGTLTNADRKYVIDGSGIHPNLSSPMVISELNPPDPQCMIGAEKTSMAIVRAGLEKIRLDKMLFQLSVPKPDLIFPLYYDCLEVVSGYETEPCNILTPHCTGLRFFYRWETGSHVTLTPPAGESSNITPPVFREFAGVADIEVRYEGLNLNDENDPHADSRACFASLAVLAGVERWLNYNDAKSSPTNPSRCKQLKQTGPNLLVHSGGDCHSPIIVAGMILHAKGYSDAN